jgi:predicted permease
MEAATLDLRHALRALASGRLFTMVAGVVLALAIATNATMFSVFDAMFLRPLPFRDGDRLVAISGRHAETGRRMALAATDLQELTAGTTAFESIAAHAGRTATLSDGQGDAERISVQQVYWNLFETLGVAPQRGRALDASDDRAGAALVALVSDSLWRRRYQAGADAIGQTIRLDDAAYTIVGVMPPAFRFPTASDVWVALAPALAGAGGASRTVSALGRLAPGVTIDQANAALGARVLPARGSRPPRSATARTFASATIGSEERTIVGALMGATTVVLLLACANVANLLLARGAHRRREIALRTALGASRARIVRQLVAEAILLALMAAALALPLAWYGIRWMHDAVPPAEPLGPYYVEWALDIRTFAYATTVAVLTGVGFGLGPALHAAGRQLVNPLRESAGAAGSRRQRRLHGALIVGQMALALVVLAGASLFVRTYVRQSRIELGFDTAPLMTLRVYFAGTAYDEPETRARAIDGIAARLTAIPGAHAATVSDLVPLDDQGGSDAAVAIEGRAFDAENAPEIHVAGVAGRWLETFDLRPISGRGFYDHELQAATPVALINEIFAARFWPGQQAVGQRFRLAEEDSNPWVTVIGVVPAIHTVKLDENFPVPATAYLPHRALSTRNYGIVVRSRTQPAAVVPDVRAAVRAVDPSLALFDVYPMEQVRWLSYWMYVMWGTMFGAFAIIALVIAAAGVYGVVFYTVSQRTREIGVRVALGAGRAQIVGPMLRQIALQSAAGLAIGLAGAILITPAVGSLLLDISPHDPAGLAGVCVILFAAALLATWLPAWRASAVDPIEALRDH